MNLHIAPIKTISGDAFLKKIVPWDKEVEKIFDSLAKHGKAYTSDIKITRGLGRKYPDLFDNKSGFLDIGPIAKRKQSMIVSRIGVQIIPFPEPDSESIKMRRNKKYGIYRL